MPPSRTLTRPISIKVSKSYGLKAQIPKTSSKPIETNESNPYNNIVIMTVLSILFTKENRL
jgi:hypothetical protein